MWLYSFVLLLGVAVADSLLDVCAWDGGIPKLYTMYGEEACPPKNHLAPNGVDCVDRWLGAYCASYCQMRTHFFYTQETPFVGPWSCRGESTCKLSESVHQSIGGKLKANFGAKWEALNFGITGGWNTKSGTSQSYSINKHLNQGECGYFTYIPIKKETCGTYSETGTDHSHCTTPYEILVPNQCNEPGVRLPRDAPEYEAYRKYRKANANNIDATVTPEDAKCDSNQDHRPNGQDCVEAISALLDNPGKELNTDNPVTSGNCAIKTELDPAWADAPCLATNLDVVGAAQSILNACTDVDGSTVGGSLSLGGKAGCYKVSFGKA